MGKRYTKAELDRMSLADKIEAYNQMADEEGAATRQQRSTSGSLPTDLNRRLSTPAYTQEYPYATSSPFRRAVRSVSESEIESANARRRRLKAYIAAHPTGPLPPDWDNNRNAKGGKVKKMAKGGKVKKMAKGGKVRGCGCAKRGLTKGKMV